MRSCRPQAGAPRRSELPQAAPHSTAAAAQPQPQPAVSDDGGARLCSHWGRWCSEGTSTAPLAIARRPQQRSRRVDASGR